MKLATPKDLLDGRTRANRYLATPGSCARCDGRGRFHDTNEECYCDCAAGILRKQLETEPQPPPLPVYELFHSYRKGWRDAAFSNHKDSKFTEHKTRPDLTAQYLEGYEDGRKAFTAAMNLEMKRVGYVPNLLRDVPEGSA